MRNLKFLFGIIIGIIIARESIAVDLSGDLFSHDPATIIKEGDTYYHFHTSWGIRSATSKDLQHWTETNKLVFSLSPSYTETYPSWTIPYLGDGNLWAPDIIYMNGAYYLYYSCSSFGSPVSAIGVVKSSSLSNPSWEDLGKVVSSSTGSDINAIDPGLFKDDDGKVYMVYGSWSGGIGIVDIDTVTGLATSSVTHLYGGNYLDTEAPAIFKEDGYYYLVVNRGTCCNGLNSSYYIIVGRSTNVKGPYTDFRTLLPNKSGKYVGPGHFSLLRDPCANYVSIHYYNANANGRATLDILKMKMVDGWPELYREFTFDNCNDELRMEAGGNSEACENLNFDLSELNPEPQAMFYSSLAWSDNGAGGSFNDSTLLKPVYSPPGDYTGNINLSLTAVGNDTGMVLKDTVALNLIENNIIIDAGSDEEILQGDYINLADALTPPTASNYTSIKWDDGEAGGKFVNTTALEAIYSPSDDFGGEIILTITANGEGHCINSDSMKLTVTVSIDDLMEENIKIYPNPSKDGSFNIDLTNNPFLPDFISVDIYNYDGRKVYTDKIERNGMIYLNTGLNPGIYQVILKSENTFFHRKKLLVE